MKICLLQLNYQVGDLEGNQKKIISKINELRSENIDLFITSELALTGYPPKDLLLDSSFPNRTIEKVKDIAVALKNAPPILLGAVDKSGSLSSPTLFNAAFLLQEGEVKGVVHKQMISAESVFDEARYFRTSARKSFFTINGKKIGLVIGEDCWEQQEKERCAVELPSVLEKLNHAQVDLIVNMTASPFVLHRQGEKRKRLSAVAKQLNMHLLAVNQVGGNDDLVFDGRSVVFSPTGALIDEGEAFKENTLIIDLDSNKKPHPSTVLDEEEEIWHALVTGTRDYIQKCGFKKVVLGLSGGIDSALTAAVALHAVGSENVDVVLMPSRYSSQHSVDDSLELAQRMGIRSHTIEINDIVEQFEKSLSPMFKGYDIDSTEENIQARVRGNLLMAISNKQKSLLLTTGNKSELAVGYCTIYGDMAGGLAVISDLSKTLVYRLSRWINKKFGEIIPENIINKAPSAELRPDQTDQDSLPPYDLLDQILYHHIEQHEGRDQLIARGFETKMVEKIIHLVKISEFKRSQAAPGLNVTGKAFGTGWRQPISSKIS